MTLTPKQLASWPQYQSHKTVRAVRITDIAADTLTHNIVFRVDPDMNVWANTERMPQLAKAEVGGYLVQYEDGYLSFSPAKAFEDGYTALAEADAHIDKQRLRVERAVAEINAWKERYERLLRQEPEELAKLKRYVKGLEEEVSSNERRPYENLADVPAERDARETRIWNHAIDAALEVLEANARDGAGLDPLRAMAVGSQIARLRKPTEIDGSFASLAPSAASDQDDGSLDESDRGWNDAVKAIHAYIIAVRHTVIGDGDKTLLDTIAGVVASFQVGSVAEVADRPDTLEAFGIPSRPQPRPVHLKWSSGRWKPSDWVTPAANQPVKPEPNGVDLKVSMASDFHDKPQPVAADAERLRIAYEGGKRDGEGWGWNEAVNTMHAWLKGQQTHPEATIRIGLALMQLERLVQRTATNPLGQIRSIDGGGQA